MMVRRGMLNLSRPALQQRSLMINLQRQRLPI